MTKIDVVVPCYNYGRYLHSCVVSVLQQSIQDVRILIIDDASTDDSVSVARQLATSDRRVSLIAHTRNAGHINTYNEGIEWAAADYFLLLSADDLLVAGALERATEIMDSHSDIVLTYGDCVTWQEPAPLPLVRPALQYSWSRHDLLHEMCATARNTLPTPTAIGRTRIQKLIGGYRPSLPHAGDLEMWLRFSAHGSVARINAPQAIYRRHATAMSNAYYARMISDYEQCQKAFDAFFDEYHHRLKERSSLRQLARKRLAKRAFRSGIGLIRLGRLRDGLQLMRAAVGINHG